MKNTPSALKWLAEKRARIAGELQSCDQSIESMRADIDALQLKLEECKRFEATAQVKRERLVQALSALDQSVVIFDSRLQPSKIEPVNGWQGKYGARGALKKYLLATLSESSPKYLSTEDLAYRAIDYFALTFVHPDDRLRWYRHSLRGALKVLAADGLVERGHDANSHSFGHTLGTWRAAPKPSVPTATEGSSESCLA